MEGFVDIMDLYRVRYKYHGKDPGPGKFDMDALEIKAVASTVRKNKEIDISNFSERIIDYMEVRCARDILSQNGGSSAPVDIGNGTEHKSI